MTIQQQLQGVSRALEEVTCEARSEAELILAHAYGISKTALIMRFFDEAEHRDLVDDIVQRRLEGAPLAYILHCRDFYGREYYVDENVLIPRFDTESVAEAAIHAIEEHGYKEAADICCGTGCLGITLLLETSVRRMLFGDISAPALAVARKNQERLAFEKRAVFRQGDLLEVIDRPVDFIVANPPYIPRPELSRLERQVRDFEPHLALDGGADGLDYYRRLVQGAQERLNPGGMLLCEIGDNQEEHCLRLFAQAEWEAIRTGKDISGTPRWIAGRRRWKGDDIAGKDQGNSRTGPGTVAADGRT